MKNPHQEMRQQLIFESPEEAERTFYQAFATCDTAAMGQVWAQEDVLCVHPGSTLLRGRTAVLHSWAQIFSNASKPTIRIQIIKRLRHAELAVHVVEEHITPMDPSDASPTLVLATNTFRLIDGAWLLVAHHASLPLVNSDADVPGGVLH